MPGPDAITQLAQLWRHFEPDAAIRAITETAARALGVGRASVWLLDERATAMTCVDLYDAASDRHAAGQVLPAADIPAYFAAMLADETIAAADAHRDPRTSELSLTYLGPLGIGALLDAPIRTGGQMVGVLCHEHVGGVRDWGAHECTDAATMASLAAVTLELEDRARREALRAATLESSVAGMLATDGARVVAFNKRFVELWQIDAATLRSLDAVRGHLAARTVAGDPDGGAAGDDPALLELDDGRVIERTVRPQVVSGRVIGRIWSYRDVTAQRRSATRISR